MIVGTGNRRAANCNWKEIPKLAMNNRTKIYINCFVLALSIVAMNQNLVYDLTQVYSCIKKSWTCIYIIF